MWKMSSYTTPQWNNLLRQHERIQASIDDRLKRVVFELHHLDALRQSLTTPKYEGVSARYRTVVLSSTSTVAAIASSPSKSSSRKRRRDDSDNEIPAVCFLKVHGVGRRPTNSLAIDPFEDAGLFAKECNPRAQFAPVQLSADEVVRQQLVRFFTTSPALSAPKHKDLPLPAVARIHSYMSAAGVAKALYSIRRNSLGYAYLSVDCPSSFPTSDNGNAEDIQKLERLFSRVQNSNLMRDLRVSLCADPAAVESCAYAELAERATAAQMLPSLERVLPAVKLLGLGSCEKPKRALAEWTFAQCWQCADRDVTESSLVQWIQTLRCTRPPKLEAFPMQDTMLYAAVCYVLLRNLKAASTVRQRYLAYVWMACSGCSRPINAHALSSRQKASNFFEHILTAYEEAPFPFPSISSQRGLRKQSCLSTSKATQI